MERRNEWPSLRNRRARSPDLSETRICVSGAGSDGSRGARGTETRWRELCCRPRRAIWQLTFPTSRVELRAATWRAPTRLLGTAAERPRELSADQCLSLVDRLAEQGVEDVTLVAGEAYLRSDWLQIVRAVRTRGMSCGMSSSGRGFHGECARAAAAAGLQTVSISLDGLEATHDRLRGVRGSYRSALSALTHLRAASMPISVETRINRLSLPELEPLLETIIAQGVHAWQVQLTVEPTGVESTGAAPATREAEARPRAREQRQVDTVAASDVRLLASDLLRLLPVLAELKRKCNEAGVRLWAGDDLGQSGPFEAALRGSLPRAQSKRASASEEESTCGLGHGTVSIQADGTISVCAVEAAVTWP